jgi:hypothetical protein
MADRLEQLLARFSLVGPGPVRPGFETSPWTVFGSYFEVELGLAGWFDIVSVLVAI